MIFSYSKYCFILFNVNEHLPVTLLNWHRLGTAWATSGFFCLHRITFLSIPSHTSLILVIVWNLPCYLHFTFCLLSDQTQCTSHRSYRKITQPKMMMQIIMQMITLKKMLVLICKKISVDRSNQRTQKSR